ncbi:pollen-specific leucine-rich repeat extensin-like protein 3 [Cornus florida]|uniref:pollen-specific leucine-rich repeat extensin-like protein 3 n=1 Tax=Cornus florida TaxID=4283 RepID=UPI0028990823|nr:pollen-specific leucine-rich repeat extensin-like protein 3 [Cornus florida]
MLRHPILYIDKDESGYNIDPSLTFENPGLKRAYIALQAWKKAMYSDPFNTTGNWVGANVRAYNGILCSLARDDPKLKVVSGVHLNNVDIARYFSIELTLLIDPTTFHINTNRFCGIIPDSFFKL